MTGDGARDGSRPPADPLRPLRSSTQVLDRLAELAARLLAAPAAQVSLVSDEAVVRAGHGLPEGAVGSRRPLADSLCAVTVGLGDVLAVSDARTDDRVAHLAPVTGGDVGAYLGVPLAGPDGRAWGALCVLDSRPRAWSAMDVGVLRHLAASVVTELELGAVSARLALSQARGDLAMQAAGIGTFDWDLRTGRLSWDQRMLELLDHDEQTFDHTIASFEARLHPDDVPRVRAEVQAAVDARAEFGLEYRVVCRDGQLRSVQARGRVLVDEDDEPCRVLGAGYDTTASREGEARVARLLEWMPAAFYALDRDWRFTYVNTAAEQLLRTPRQELLGAVLWEKFPMTLGWEAERCFRQAMSTGEPVVFEQQYGPDQELAFEVRAWPGPEGLSVYAVDISQRRADERKLARAGEQWALLATVSAELARTLNVSEAARRLARAVVPQLADWAVVTLLEVGGPVGGRRMRDVASWHADPQRRELVAEYAALRLTDLADPAVSLRTATEAVPVVLHADAASTVAAALRPGRSRDLLLQLAPEALTVLPLRAHGRTLGLLSLFRDRPDGPVADELAATATQVADRAALALDNARLYAEQRGLAGALQRSLLTAPPQPDHVQVVVRYESAALAAQVGGDWYDAFLQRDGATVLVIGDVVGHDTEAAAAMGQVRGLLRALGARETDSPMAVLAQLDAVIELLEVDTTVTAVVARLEQDAAQRAQGATVLRWSNAGHPPPMVLTSSGSVQVLDVAPDREADLLLGIDPRTDRTESTVLLHGGDTVLLYTDGLVERRDQSLDEGLGRLRDLLAELADLPLEQLCDQVLDRMLPDPPDDDVALAAVRLHPQDRPRPPEAGPVSVPPALW